MFKVVYLIGKEAYIILVKICIILTFNGIWIVTDTFLLFRKIKQEACAGIGIRFHWGREW